MINMFLELASNLASGWYKFIWAMKFFIPMPMPKTVCRTLS